MEDGFTNAEDSYSDSTDYSDSASDEDSSAVTLQDDNYVVEPKWQGLISKSDAATLFDDNYNDPDGNSFVGGTANEGYKQIKQEQTRSITTAKKPRLRLSTRSAIPSVRSSTGSTTPLTMAITT